MLDYYLFILIFISVNVVIIITFLGQTALQRTQEGAQIRKPAQRTHEWPLLLAVSKLRWKTQEGPWRSSIVSKDDDENDKDDDEDDVGNDDDRMSAIATSSS